MLVHVDGLQKMLLMSGTCRVTISCNNCSQMPFVTLRTHTGYRSEAISNLDPAHVTPMTYPMNHYWQTDSITTITITANDMEGGIEVISNLQ